MYYSYAVDIKTYSKIISFCLLTGSLCRNGFDRVAATLLGAICCTYKVNSYFPSVVHIVPMEFEVKCLFLWTPNYKKSDAA